MKFFPIILFISIGVSLLSGCAYIEGRKDQAAAPAAIMKPATKTASTVRKAKVIPPQNGPAPVVNSAPTPSYNAAKMITPLTQ